MKYIIDLDALKDCLDLLSASYDEYSGEYKIDLQSVKLMIDKFPKEEVKDKKDKPETVYR